VDPAGQEFDLTYHPVGADVDEILEAREPTQLLLVGRDLPESFELATESRYLTEPEVQLPTGVYTFVVEHGHSVMVVTDGAAPGQPVQDSWDAPDEAPLIQAYGWFDAWWHLARPVPTPAFSVSDAVVTVPSGQEATVRRRLFDRGRWSYQVRVEGRTTLVGESGLSFPDHDDDPYEWVRGDPAPAHRFAATLTRVKLQEQLTDTVYSFRASRTIFRPYQFRPVIRLLETGRLRLLIADEVGLGKTIEAGLIWTELDARNQAGRVLVVCPSMLVAKWRGEMEERFGFDTEELDSKSLGDLLDRLETDRLRSRFHAVCSLERLRSWGGLERMAELAPRFDLVIVDEAHSFRNQETRSHALGALLSDWADALVFLSATPLNLGNNDLFSLLQLLAPGDFDDKAVLQDRLEPNAVLNRIAASLLDRATDNTTRSAWLSRISQLTFGSAVTRRPEYGTLERLLAQPELGPPEVVEARRLIAELHALSAVVTRTRKVEIQEAKAVREARPIDVEWTEAERDLYNAIDLWQRARAKAKGMPVAFIGQMPLRLAGSCLPAARDKVLAKSAAVWTQGDMDQLDAIEPEDIPPVEVVHLAGALGDVDSKFDAFIEPLTGIVEQGRQVLIFTFSRDTLAYLQRRLSAHFRVDALHGGIKSADRGDVMRRFRENEFDVMVASRVASEGLDFEFCSAVVNYDLPWNPMEVEQRIGRIDRFGQTEEKVIILNFHTPGTIETDIVERVHQRIGVFNDSIGELEPILQSKTSELRDLMFDFSLTHDQRQRRIDETMTAIEAQAQEREKVESASQYLASTDRAEIDGLEDELLSQGRYVGQPELVRLLEDWFAADPNARLSKSTDGLWLELKGTPLLEQHLAGIRAAGERSAADIAQWGTAFRDERAVSICLDQETARTSRASLLAANHPLVRAALRVPGYDQARFGRVRINHSELRPGVYFVLVALARWVGVRPSAEFWTAVEPLDGSDNQPEVGAALLAALADAQIFEGNDEPVLGLDRQLANAERQLLRRQEAEMARRLAENDALVEARRISLRESHDRKIRQIDSRIETLRQKHSFKVIPLHEAQRTTQGGRLSEALSQLEATRQGGMDVEPVAVCVVEVAR
jgi:superfamily II DNA or RNA helicase